LPQCGGVHVQLCMMFGIGDRFQLFPLQPEALPRQPEFLEDISRL
jgi:hypothetical protein